MKQHLACHLALLLAALVLPPVIACGRPEPPPVEPAPPAIAEAAVTMATAGAVHQEVAAPGSRELVLPRRDLIRSTTVRLYGGFPLAGREGERVHFRPLIRGIEHQLGQLEPVTVRGLACYLREGAWITSLRAIGSKYTMTKWDDDAPALLCHPQEDGVWMEMTITRASGGSVSRAGLIEAAESNPLVTIPR